MKSLTNLSLSKKFTKHLTLPNLVIGLNILASFPFLYFFTNTFYWLFMADIFNPPINGTSPRLIIDYLWLVIPLIGALIPLFAVYRLYKSKTRRTIYLGIALFHLSFYSMVIFLILFGGASLLETLGLVLLIFSIFFIVWNLNKKLAVVLTIISIILTIYSFTSGFEESYCWNIGVKISEKSGSMCLPPTEEEKKDDPGIGCIAPGWRAHLECHRTFNFKKTFLEELHLK